jgi:hypothetical protein
MSKTTKPDAPATSPAAHGSAASYEKLMWWRCVNCGYDNHAPADQSPHNVVMCYACEKLFEWHEVLRRQTPPNIVLGQPNSDKQL